MKHSLRVTVEALILSHLPHHPPASRRTTLKVVIVTIISIILGLSEGHNS